MFEKEDDEYVKVIILYDSKFGNTKKVALSLSRGLEQGGFLVDCYSIQNTSIDIILRYDVIAIGGPTHLHGISKALRLFLSKIKKPVIQNKSGFAFETKIDHPFAGSAAKQILKFLKKNKVKIIHSKITGIVIGREGPLEKDAIKNIEKIGVDIASYLKNLNGKSGD